MSNDTTNLWERLFKLWAKICMMIVDGKRGLYEVAEHLQVIIDEKVQFLPLDQKFQQVMNLGVITVPDDYEHGTRLTKFWEKFGDDFSESFPEYNRPDLCDEVFSKPSHILSPKQQYRVRIFGGVYGTWLKERMRFLEEIGAILPGPQGLTLLWEQKKEQLLEELPQKNGRHLIFCYEDRDHAPRSRHNYASHSALEINRYSLHPNQQFKVELSPACYCPTWEDCTETMYETNCLFVAFTPVTAEETEEEETAPTETEDLDKGGLIEPPDGL